MHLSNICIFIYDLHLTLPLSEPLPHLLRYKVVKLHSKV